MYPYLRMALHVRAARRAAPLPLTGTHVSHHWITPFDIDPWMELNNGRTLTLFDLGRVGMGIRIGLPQVMKRNGWGLTVAGNTVRYRKRVTVGTKLVMHTRCIGSDDRFLYVEQSMWRGGDCTSHMLLRSAVVENRRMIPPARLLDALDAPRPELPTWVRAWSDADAMRPWPPEVSPCENGPLDASSPGKKG